VGARTRPARASSRARLNGLTSNDFLITGNRLRPALP
jgi:hypothetical protein